LLINAQKPQIKDGLLYLVYIYNERETPYAEGEANSIKHVVIYPDRIWYYFVN